ncbi:MAG TPA: hypothetical protein VK154_06000, partial [Chitinophagales bacterium]|nr:hypothetical protein [Chitinophagales bacterium]
HGLAINISTDLSYFTKIMACGLDGKGTTSLEKELGRSITVDEFKSAFTKSFQSIFGVSIPQSDSRIPN